MKILFLTFYYSPDLCAGSFRSARLVKAMTEKLADCMHIDVITTQPNRYESYSEMAPDIEELPGLTVRRVMITGHKSGMLDQAWAFIGYARAVLRLVRGADYQLVCATSSRLMTAALSAYVARKKRAPLYLDIRDIFLDTITELLPKQITVLTKPLFMFLERRAICQASRINLISEGFKEYFQSRYPKKNYTYYTHCIDPEFIRIGRDLNKKKITMVRKVLTVLYAGNIGEGQGLHRIIPELAKRLEGKVLFRLIGDGGRKSQLERLLSESNCENVELLPPVRQNRLIAEYEMADILFVHLNDYDAFKKVLPSKLFEYASTGKPIWAGVSGYAAAFIKAEIRNATVFQPCNVDDGLKAFGTLDISCVNRAKFVEKYSCGTIMEKMSKDIIACGLKQS